MGCNGRRNLKRYQHSTSKGSLGGVGVIRAEELPKGQVQFVPTLSVDTPGGKITFSQTILSLALIPHLLRKNMREYKR